VQSSLKVLHTQIFLDAVGTGGKVVAIEPSPSSAQKCRDLIQQRSLSNLTVIESAMSNINGVASLSMDGDPTSPTNRLDSSSKAALKVSVITGDSLVITEAFPNVIKIDVEGYEVEVLNSMHQILTSSCVKFVFVEVHFALLEKRGLRNGAEEIIKIFKQHNFNVNWIDFSHIMGFKD